MISTIKLDERYRKIRKSGLDKNESLQILLSEGIGVAEVKYLYDHIPPADRERYFMGNILTTIGLFTVCGVVTFAIDATREFQLSGEFGFMFFLFKLDVFVAIASVWMSYIIPQRFVETLGLSVFFLANDAVSLSDDQDIVKLILVFVAAVGGFFLANINMKILEKHRLDQPFEKWLKSREISVVDDTP